MHTSDITSYYAIHIINKAGWGWAGLGQAELGWLAGLFELIADETSLTVVVYYMQIIRADARTFATPACIFRIVFRTPPPLRLRARQNGIVARLVLHKTHAGAYSRSLDGPSGRSHYACVSVCVCGQLCSSENQFNIYLSGNVRLWERGRSHGWELGAQSLVS